MASAAMGGFSHTEVRQQLEMLYFHAEPAVKQSANSYLMRFQEDSVAWGVSEELLRDTAPHVQFMGAQTLYLKVKRQWNTLPDQAGFVARLFAYLRDCSGALQAHTALRLALCVSALAVRTMLAGWASALEDIVQFGRDPSVPQGRCLAAQMLAAVPEEIQDVPSMGYQKTLPINEALLFKVNLLIAYLLECLDGLDTKPGGLCEVSFQCLVQWSKSLQARFLANEALSQCLIRLLSMDVLTESLLEVFIECLQSSSMAASIWKVKNWQAEVPGCKLLANGPEGACLRALLDQLQALHPRLEQMCSGVAIGGVDEESERRLCAWARVVLMLCESYTQLLFEEQCDFLLRFLGCCFKLSAATAQPLFEFWGQMKEMHREDLLTTQQVQMVLMRLTEPCTVSLLQYVRRDAPHSVGAGGASEELRTLRDMAKDVACDMFCLWQRCDAAKSVEYLGFLSQSLIQAINAQDSVATEAALVLLEGIVDVVESPLPPPFVEALRWIPRMSNESNAMAAGAVLLQRCAPHMNAHVDVLPDSLEFLIRALPAIPYTAADSVLELTGYAGHHLTSALPRFLAAVEQLAPRFPEKVDATLYSAVVCTMRRLPAPEAAAAFQSVLQATSRQLQALAAQTEEQPGGPLRLPEAARPQFFRLLARLRGCIWTLEQTPDDPDGPPPTGGADKGGVAICVLTVLAPVWDAFSRTIEAVLATAPAELAREVVAHVRNRTDPPDHSFNEAALVAASLKILRSCVSAAQSPGLSDADAVRFVRMLLHLLAAVIRRGPPHHLALSPLAGLLAAAAKHSLHEEFGAAFQAVCEITVQRLRANGGGASLEELTPFFELLLACGTHMEQALYSSQCFGQLEELAVASLGSGDRDLNRAVLQFLVKFAESKDPAVQRLFAEFAPSLARGMLQHFHLWPQATRKFSSGLFALLLERHPTQFHQELLLVWQQPNGQGVHSVLSAEQREACRLLFGQLKGPKLKAFLGDLASIANGLQTPDVLGCYQMAGG